MVKQNGPTRHWNSIFIYIATTNKTTGQNCYHWLSLLTTMLLVLPLVVSPFFANKEYHPNLIVYPEQDIASSRARNFIVDLDKLQSILKEEIAKA